MKKVALDKRLETRGSSTPRVSCLTSRAQPLKPLKLLKPLKPSSLGQALIELAVGMLALAILVSALCAFAVYIARSLEVQNSLRGPEPKMNKPVKLDDFAVRHFAGKDHIKMEEKAVMPPLEVRKQ